METINELETLTDNEKESVNIFRSYLENVAKFRGKGTASAAARARKDASALTKLLKTIRKELQEAKAAVVAAKKAQKA
jgi:hypothetical protein